jgi:hypothetical protein
MGYDQRVASAMRGLGYTIFPFEAFDGAGRVVLPGGIQVPDRWTQAAGRIASTPAWSEVYATLSVLDDASPAWRCFMVGVGFAPGQVRIIVFKHLRSVADAAAGVQWSTSYHAVPSATVAELAGKTYLVDPGLVEALGELAGYLQGQGPKVQDPPTQGGAADGAEAVRPSPPPEGALPGGEALPGWALLGVQAAMAVLTAASKFARGTSVLSTVVWYPGQGEGVVTGVQANAWTPINTPFSASNRRTAHGIWNPAGPSAKLPSLWYGTDRWQGWGVKDMPHTPEQVARALAPLGLAEEELAAPADPGAAAPD